MKISRAGLTLVGMATMLVVSLGAQRTSPSERTNAKLLTRIHELETEHADLARNYDQLLASCRNHAEPDDRSTGGAEPGAKRTRNADDDLFWIAALNYGVTETTSTFMRFGWKVTLHNGLGRNEIFDVTVQFLNKDDLVVESGRLGVQTIRAFEDQEVTGDVIIRLPSALNVASAKAIVNRHR
jgi:hypothetical protein